MISSASLIATWFGSGLLPKAPGTWGSLAALPFAWGIATLTGTPHSLLLAALVLLPIGAWASARHSATLGTHDAGEIVVDEVVGLWLVLGVVPVAPHWWLAGFALFRLFDVWKPWPISWLDANVHGGWGIMLDDVAAGIAGAVVLAFVFLSF
ncbi:MAG: phosphatidylglycerophosphatase A [Parvibaculum sp.]